jgi:hypothetical protein
MSAELLESSYADRGEPMPHNHRSTPYYYLVSHACELLLKAALLKRGVTDTELRRSDVRHDLQGLMDLLRERGVMITPDRAAILDGLAPQHRDHELRYTALLDNGKLTYTPAPASVYELLDELMMATRLGR